jgi:hypothetical protein
MLHEEKEAQKDGDNQTEDEVDPFHNSSFK